MFNTFAAGALNACQIAYIAGIPRSTVRAWLRNPRKSPRISPELSFDPALLPEADYSYLLGFYLGLIHSDGCRVLNRVNGKDYPRYLFDQVSDDIRRCDTCHRLGVEYTLSRWKTVSIARAASVALVDSFIGTKA